MRYFEEFSNNVYQMIAIEHELNEYEEHEREWRGKDIIVSKSSRSPLALQKTQEELVSTRDASGQKKRELFSIFIIVVLRN